MTSSVPAIVIGTVLCLGYGALAIAKIASVRSMQDRAEHLGYSTIAFRRIGALELGGALGLLGGLVWPPVGYASGIGLVLLMCGAVISHVRASAPVVTTLPAAVFCAATIAYLVTLGGAA